MQLMQFMQNMRKTLTFGFTQSGMWVYLYIAFTTRRYNSLFRFK